MFIFFNKIEFFTVGLLYIFIDHLRESKTQTADYCFHQANENVRTMVPLFFKPDETIVLSQSAVCILGPLYRYPGIFESAIFTSTCRVFNSNLLVHTYPDSLSVSQLI